MDKDKILEKSRRENIDEGKNKAKDIAINKDYIIAFIVYIVMSISNQIFKKDNSLIYGSNVIIFIFLGNLMFERYKFSRRFFYLLATIISIIIVVIYFSKYMLIVLK